MEANTKPEPGDAGQVTPPLRPVARRSEPWSDEHPADIHGHMWHWWEKVRAEIERRGVTVKQLAEAAEIPYRSLHRWLYESTLGEMRERGPIGELSIVTRLAYALGWSWWYLAGVAWQWPPSPGALRWMQAWESLIEKRRLDVLDPVAHAMASCSEMAVSAIESNERARAEMQAEVERHLDRASAPS